MRNNDLATIAAKYHCDKLTRHSYIPVYERLFADLQVRRLLEIGIGSKDIMAPFVDVYVHGCSLKMWQDYFQDAEIMGCDILQSTLFNEGRIRTFWCDQRDPECLEALIVETGGNFDIIIDDGSHELADQLLSATILLPTLTPSGVYVIEECWHPDRVTKMFPDWDVEEYYGRRQCDDMLAILRRKAVA